MIGLKGKTALVTGSASGFGRTRVLALAARGAHVPAVGRNEQRTKDVVAEIANDGGGGKFRLTTLDELKAAHDLTLAIDGGRAAK